MKFSLVQDFDEAFTSKSNKRSHFKKRQSQGQYLDCTPAEYEDRADKLSRMPIDNKKIFGYMSLTRDGLTAYCKYNKDTEDFVVYRITNGEPETITMYQKDWRQFNGDKAIEYYDELSE